MADENSGNGKAALVPQPHGGALRVGNPGNRGGHGATPSVLRGALRDKMWQSKHILSAVADGEVVQRIKVPLSVVLPHVECANCGESKLQAKDGQSASAVEISVKASASPTDRLRAIDLMGKYGVGTTTTIEKVSPDVLERLERQLQVIASRPTWDSEALLRHLDGIWQT